MPDMTRWTRTAEQRANEATSLLGVYSKARVAKGNPTTIWLGVDGQEKEITATYASEDEAFAHEDWGEVEVVGRVVKYLRPGRPEGAECQSIRGLFRLLQARY